VPSRPRPPLAALALLCCTGAPPPIDPALLAEAERTVVPNRSRPVAEGALASGLYFVVDSGFGVARTVEGERLHIDPSAIVTVEHFARIAVGESMTGRPVLHLGMDAVDATRLRAGTFNAIGQRVALVVQDRVLSAPLVQDEIPAGRLEMDPGPASPLTAADYAALLQAERKAWEGLR